jgi:2-keto-4-pentenoate hydratase/2-oxohepta-3-ene-1,7-dioic acid hydratase in catechol pathway
MKLVRIGEAGRERPGVVDPEGFIRDLSGYVADVSGDVLAPAALQRLVQLDPETLPCIRGYPRLGPPISGVGKIIGVALNYATHARETGATPPAEPVLFAKAVTALSGPFDPIVLPRNSTKTDWEAELGVVIGRQAQYVEEADALAYVAGFAVANDVSERSFQKERGGQFSKGKSCDSFAPLGPWLVTADEVIDPQDLAVWLDLNGERRQAGNTGDMIFSVSFLVSYISQFMTLMPGDVICSGTPAGVGAGCKPPRFLAAGDIVELGISGLGSQCHRVIPPDAAAGRGANPP